MGKLVAQTQDCDVHVSTREHYGQLIGAVIKHVVLVGNEQGDMTPVLLVKTAQGQDVQVEVWSDPEGNGSGHLDIYDPSTLEVN